MFQNKKGVGLIGVGRRRVGKSFQAGHAMNSLASLKDNIEIIATSKDETSINGFMKNKVKFVYSKYPGPMKHSTKAGWSIKHVHFGDLGKDEYGNQIIKGRDSVIRGFPPTPEKIEGEGIMMWFHDEGPKTKNLRTLIDYTLPALADDEGFDRAGFFYTTGVAGDFGKFGGDFEQLIKDAKRLNCEVLLIPGWVGLCTNESGNEDVEQAVYKILENRAALRGGDEISYQRQIQKYPLTLQECFLDPSIEVLPRTIISTYMNILERDPAKLYRGHYKWDITNERSSFHPDESGPIERIEGPINGAVYGAGIDTYDIRTKNEGSDGALVVVKGRVPLPPHKEELILNDIKALRREQEEGIVGATERLKNAYLRIGMIPVLKMVWSPRNPDVFSEQAAMVVKDYDMQALIERKPSTTFKWFSDHGFRPHMFWKPVKASKDHVTPGDYNEFGIQIDGYWGDIRLSSLWSFFYNYCDRIYFPDMLEGGYRYNPDRPDTKIDIIDGLGLAVIQMDDPRFELSSMNHFQGATRQQIPLTFQRRGGRIVNT